MIRELTMDYYDGIIEMFIATPGVTFREADSREAMERYLKRNPGLSFVAEEDSEIFGCILCGHDGRRGYLQHLVVRPEHRNKGVGEELVKKCIDALDKIGISKTHIFVFKTNDPGNSFWAGKGWQLREDVNMYSYNPSENVNA